MGKKAINKNQPANGTTVWCAWLLPGKGGGQPQGSAPTGLGAAFVGWDRDGHGHLK